MRLKFSTFVWYVPAFRVSTTIELKKRHKLQVSCDHVLSLANLSFWEGRREERLG